jgi:pteridine reductase
MRVDISDQVALVTGAAHRVGKAIALELARCGVHLMVHYGGSPEEVVRNTMQEIKSFGVDAFSVQADMSKPEAIEKIFADVDEHFGRLDILVNSASIFQKRGLMDVTLEEWQETLAINLTAPFLCTRAAVEMMRQNDPPGGLIVNICDKGATDAWPEYAHHGVSKAGLYALSKTSAVALGRENIRVNTIIPGAVLKPPDYSDELWQKIGAVAPLGRPGTAEDVARAVVYLAQEDYLSGVTLNIDGAEHLL